MKSIIYFIFIVIISLLGCSENPNDSNKDSILSDSRKVTNDFVFYRDSILNTDTLIVTIETPDPDVYLFINFSLGQRSIRSYNYTILHSDSSINGSSITVSPDYTEIMWTTAYELNNQGFEIQRKDTNESSYTVVGFVNGYGTSTEHHNYSFKDYNDVSKLFFYRFKQIDFNGTFEYTFEAKIEVEATDSIKAEFSITADNGVIKYSGEIAPDSGYTNNLSFNVDDLIYFRNSLLHYGKIRIKSFNFLNDHHLLIDESYKNINYNLSYEIFLQTNGERTFF